MDFHRKKLRNAKAAQPPLSGPDRGSKSGELLRLGAVQRPGFPHRGRIEPEAVPADQQHVLQVHEVVRDARLVLRLGGGLERARQQCRLAQGESVIWTDNDSDDSKGTMQTPKK